MNQNFEATNIEQASRLSTLAEHVKGSGSAVLLATAALAGANLMSSPEIAEAAPQCTTTISGDIQTIHCVDPETGSETTSTQTVQNNEPQPNQPKPVVKAPEAKQKAPVKEKLRSESNTREVKRLKFRSFNQGDWGSRSAKSGCGPTSLGMVISTETGNHRINPNTMVSKIPYKYYQWGSGTDPRAFKYVASKYGITVKGANLSTAKRSIKKGGLAIVHAKPGHFTGRGHYIVLRGVKNGKFKLADPNGNGRNHDSENRLWSAGQLKKGGIDKVWTFRKK